MQLLRIVNAMFDYKINKSELTRYHALNYAVTPLGPSSGLISWVEDTTPLFLLYKKWQQREANFLNIKQQQTDNHQIQRPNDIYYNKINSILKQRQMPRFDANKNRNDYPLDILKQSLEELIRETPNDLLSRELWCESITPASWWHTSQTFTRSTAVMSIIGYIIGLGDRHLDNILVNLSTGVVVYIDYNICFEKGHNLRLPEKIPFRLTQNIEKAFGLTGVEGLFRKSCEQVMRTLRNGQETLLTLLETFLYDPLLDWTINDNRIIGSFYGGGVTKENESKLQSKFLNRENPKIIEKKMNYRLLDIRLIENEYEMNKNATNLIQMLEKLESNINNLKNFHQHNNIDRELELELLEKAKIYLDESQTLYSNDFNKTNRDQHPIHNLHDRFTKYTQFRERFNEIETNLQQEIDHLNSLERGHSEAIQFFKVNQPFSGEEYSERSQQIQSKVPHLLTRGFFESIGQLNSLKQCESLHQELVSLRLQQKQIFETTAQLISLLDKVFTFSINADDYSFNNKDTHEKVIEWFNDIKKSFKEETLDQNLDYFNRIHSDYCEYFSHHRQTTASQDFSNNSVINSQVLESNYQMNALQNDCNLDVEHQKRLEDESKMLSINENTSVTSRQKIISQLEGNLLDLITNRKSIDSIVNKLNSNEVNIAKRLSWATNSNLLSTKNQFDSQRNERNSLLKIENDFCEKVENYFNNWLSFEKYRSLVLCDNNYRQLEMVLKSCIELSSMARVPKPSDTELFLLKFKSFSQEKVSTVVIQKYYKLLQDELASLKREKIKDDKEILKSSDDLKTNITHLKTILNQHNKIMSSIKPLLKAMNKYNDNDKHQLYSKIYLKFSECFQMLFKLLPGRDDDNNTVLLLIFENAKQLETLLIELKTIVPKIYGDLSNLKDDFKKERTVSAAAQSQTDNQEEAKNSNTKRIQEANPFAIKVLKRVNQKLEGRDPDSATILTISEHVNYLIDEATNLNKLALLYEGWTPWV
jgi:hypothetical protein